MRLRGGFDFPTVKAAEAEFEAILNAGAAGDPVLGDDGEVLDALYRDYCAATGWRLDSEPVGYVRDWQRGAGYTTKCFHAEFDDGSRVPFSYRKAVAAVART